MNKISRKHYAMWLNDRIENRLGRNYVRNPNLARKRIEAQKRQEIAAYNKSLKLED